MLCRVAAADDTLTFEPDLDKRRQDTPSYHPPVLSALRPPVTHSFAPPSKDKQKCTRGKGSGDEDTIGESLEEKR